jgi:hypothetical protein
MIVPLFLLSQCPNHLDTVHLIVHHAAFPSGAKKPEDASVKKNNEL